MPRSYKRIEREVDALVARWRRMCTCVPEPVAFASLEELGSALANRCPIHGATFDPERALVLEQGEWRPVCAPYGFPALSESDNRCDGATEFDDPEIFIDDEAAKLRAGRALYDALPVSSRPTLAAFTRKVFDFLFHYGQTQ